MTGAWHIVDVDLSKPMPDMPAGAANLLVTLWKGFIPLGRIWIDAEELPLDRPELARRIAFAITPAVGNRLFSRGFRAPLPVVGDNPAGDRPADLAALLATPRPMAALPPPPPSAAGPTVSVVICTRHRPDSLRACLASLELLDPPPDEILVVDNAPENDATHTLVAGFPSVRYLAEARPGLSRARNAGWRAAQGEIIAWTDDDTTVHPRWIAALREGFRDPAVQAVTGLVLPGELQTDAQVHFERDRGGFQRGFRAFQLDADYFEKMKTHGVPTWEVGAGANMAFRRSVFAAVGPFDERLGAGASGCSEDSEFWYRMLAAGMVIRYEPGAVVWHFHRRTEDELRSQMEDYMRGHVAALLYQFQKTRHRGNLRRVFLSLPRHYLGMIRRRNRGSAPDTVAAEIRGCLRGILQYLRNNS